MSIILKSLRLFNVLSEPEGYFIDPEHISCHGICFNLISPCLYLVL